jgi:hypothetical protein
LGEPTPLGEEGALGIWVPLGGCDAFGELNCGGGIGDWTPLGGGPFGGCAGSVAPGGALAPGLPLVGAPLVAGGSTLELGVPG